MRSLTSSSNTATTTPITSTTTAVVAIIRVPRTVVYLSAFLKRFVAL